MLKNFLFVTCILFCANPLFAQNKPITYTKYTDNKNKIAIKHPANWVQKPVDGAAFFFIRPKEETGQKFAENINLIIDPPDDLSLDEYAGVARNKLKTEMKDYQEIKCEYAKYNKRDFFKINYTFTYNQLKMHDVYYVTIYQGKAYSLTCSAITTTFTRFYPVFEAMMGSFEIK